MGGTVISNHSGLPANETGAELGVKLRCHLFPLEPSSQLPPNKSLRGTDLHQNVCSHRGKKNTPWTKKVEGLFPANAE